MLFGMVERGMDGEVIGDKGKLRGQVGEGANKKAGQEAMWAIMMAKELWKKGIWYVISKCRTPSSYFFIHKERC
jgi:protein SDA1